MGSDERILTVGGEPLCLRKVLLEVGVLRLFDVCWKPQKATSFHYGAV